MYDLVISEEAEDDIQGIVDYYDLISVALADRFLGELDQKLDKIRKLPEGYQKRIASTRMAFLDHFPFGVHYKTYMNSIVVIAVLHTSRNPMKWRS